MKNAVTCRHGACNAWQELLPSLPQVNEKPGPWG